MSILVLKYSVFIPFTIFFDIVYQIVHNKQITDKISFLRKIRFFKTIFPSFGRWALSLSFDSFAEALVDFFFSQRLSTVSQNRHINSLDSFISLNIYFDFLVPPLIRKALHNLLLFTGRFWTIAKHVVSNEMRLSKLNILKRYPFIHKWIIPILMLFVIRSFTGRICVVMVLCIVILIL